MSLHLYEVRPRKDHRDVDLIPDALPFGRLWYGEPNAISNAVDYAKFFSRSHDVVIRVYDEAGNVIETHEKLSNHGGKRASLPSDGTFRGLKSRASLCPSAICSRVILFSTMVILCFASSLPCPAASSHFRASASAFATPSPLL